MYNNALEPMIEEQAMIIDENSFADLLKTNHLVFIGNGAAKVENVIGNANAEFMSGIKPEALNMMALSEKAFREKEFIDVAYSTPLYLKEFQATKSKKKVL